VNALSSVLGKSAKGSNIGVLLPNSLANLATILSLHKLNKVPAMLNFSAGSTNIINACKTAEIHTILTSRAFVEKAELHEIIAHLKDFEIVYLEDIGKKISKITKLSSLILSYFPERIFADALKVSSHSPAVILFTSGSEGVPKGVALSHTNIQANIKQAESIIDFSSRDIVLNAMPMFHSFGLTVGTFLPIMCGMRMFLYPSPLHFNIIPEIAYALRATLMFGTDTFLTRYAKAAHPYDFSSIRYVIAGAEKLKQSTRETWFEKFGIRIFEGYGVSETSPFISVNSAMNYKSGTVGKIAPGMEYKLVPVEGIAEGGELWVRGPNIMLGYIKLDKPGVLQPPADGWYATGDIVTIDEDGFLKIVGRAKRFAKIAGEMVSLPMVEECAAHLWKDDPVAVIAIKDEKKGEQVVLVTPNKAHNLEQFKKFAIERGLPEIAIPRNIHYADIPLLGSGKTDYPKLQKIVEESA
jgi:acyl-[acyl-carrier-protein]-phospholipid O-acyltransferase/long-chain-fatty-acid--[acyl-carrier-protein] ligase